MYGAAFWFFTVLALASFILETVGPSSPEELIQAGVRHAQEGRTDLARSEFLAAVEGADGPMVTMAYHNLALLSARRSLEAVGDQVEDSAREAIEFAEAALILAPGSEATADILELALRRLAESPVQDQPQPNPQPAQQSRQSDADTENEGVGRLEETRGQGPSSDPGLSREAATRLLTSFRLMEREGVLGAIRSRMKSGPGTIPNRRRGPPW
jgi:hypothetical protein